MAPAAASADSLAISFVGGIGMAPAIASTDSLGQLSPNANFEEDKDDSESNYSCGNAS
jgi:hypothetical protein